MFRESGFDPLRANRLDIRRYLGKFIDRPANTYANILKSLRIFYRDYLGRGDLIEGFKFPSRPFRAIKVPSKEDLKELVVSVSHDEISL